MTLPIYPENVWASPIAPSASVCISENWDNTRGWLWGLIEIKPVRCLVSFVHSKLSVSGITQEH